MAEWTAKTEAEAVLRMVLTEDVAGFPVPTEAELVQRVQEQLARRGYRLAPIVRRRVFVPAVFPYPEGIRYAWLWVPSGSIAWGSSSDVPPTGIRDTGDNWQLLYREVIEDVTVTSQDGSDHGSPPA